MSSTSASLLERVRKPSDRTAWDRFVKLYTPLLFSWARRLKLREADAADLVQEVFLILVKKLPDFQYDRDKSFRGWLWTVVRHKFLERTRRDEMKPLLGREEHLADVDGAELFAEEEYRKYLVRRALDLMRTEFQALTWTACLEFVMTDKSAAQVAQELGTSAEVVWAAKSRVLRRLREELDGLLD